MKTKIQLRPKPWTHHHTHRLLHLSMGFSFAFAALAMVGTMAAFWMQAGASSISESGNITISANVIGVNPGPSQTTSGSKNPIPPKFDPTITITAEPVGQVPFKNNFYIFDNSHPAFSGLSSVPNGLVFITIRGTSPGANNINSTAQADANGNWFWQSPYNLYKGNYTIRVVVFDSYDLTRSGSAQAQFTVPVTDAKPTPQPGGQPGSTGSVPGVPEPPTTPGSEKMLFGVFFNILNNYKYILNGDRVVGSTTLVSNSDKEIENQAISYKIINPQGQTILETTDTVSFSHKAQVLKTFFIAPKTPSGDYTIIVSGTYQGVTSVASDTFRIIAASASNGGTITGGVSSDNVYPQGPIIIWFLLLLLLLLFIILMIIAYRHARRYTEELNKELNREDKKAAA